MKIHIQMKKMITKTTYMMIDKKNLKINQVKMLRTQEEERKDLTN